MKSKFKVRNKVLDDCGCIYRIKKVGWKYYTLKETILPICSAKVTVRKGKATVAKTIKNKLMTFQIEIKKLDARAVIGANA